MAKALGADIIDFYHNGWPEGWYHDDNALEVEENDEEKEVVQPDQKYDLNDLGVLIKEKPMAISFGPEETISFSTAFNRWKKARDFETMIVFVPKDKGTEFRQEMKARGFKVS